MMMLIKRKLKMKYIRRLILSFSLYSQLFGRGKSGAHAAEHGHNLIPVVVVLNLPELTGYNPLWPKKKTNLDALITYIFVCEWVALQAELIHDIILRTRTPFLATRVSPDLAHSEKGKDKILT